MASTRKYVYTITSCRAYRRNDEYRNLFYSDSEHKVGDAIELDGILWFVEEAALNRPEGGDA